MIFILLILVVDIMVILNWKMISAVKSILHSWLLIMIILDIIHQELSGAKVTLAHEFHHGIQMGNYILRFEDTFFYEITSTAMEEFVYDDVNDYYAYMSSYFLSPQRAFPENDGYNLAIWNIYLKDIFGFGLLKRQWEILPTQRAMNAINLSLSEKSTSFKHELNNFGIWTYHTKYRAIPGKYFEEASKYPLVRPLSTIAFTSPSEIITINSKPTANNFIRFTNQSNNNDTLYVLITNGDVQGAVNNLSQTDSISILFIRLSGKRCKQN